MTKFNSFKITLIQYRFNILLKHIITIGALPLKCNFLNEFYFIYGQS